MLYLAYARFFAGQEPKSLLEGFTNDVVDDYSNRTLTTINSLRIEDDWAQIPYGTAIDFGGCGKGYMGDLLAKTMEAYDDIAGYWFSLGGDVVARGSDEHSRPWIIYVEHADGRPGYAGSATLDSNAMSAPVTAVATSSTAIRSGVQSGKKWHHLIDPRTQVPAVTDIVSATIRASSLLEADVLASCVTIVGSEESRSYLINHSKSVDGVLLQCGTTGALQTMCFSKGIRPKPVPLPV